MSRDAKRWGFDTLGYRRGAIFGTSLLQITGTSTVSVLVLDFEHLQLRFRWLVRQFHFTFL